MFSNQVSLNYDSRRSPIIGSGGMVATSQPLAAAAGIDILSSGGNAADAAVATAAALNVTEPTSTGIGGDCFILFYKASTKTTYALNGSGRSPSKLTIDLVNNADFPKSKEGKPFLPPFHPYTITVPGAVAGWVDLVDRFGSLSLETILAPAIQLAENGYPVAPITSYFWERGLNRQLQLAANGFELTLNGKAPQPGEIFTNPGLAKTLREIAEKGKNSFYQGKIAEDIVKVIQASGGVMSLDDMASHQSTWDSPISTSYRGFRLWECPPNGQGLGALLALNILECFDLSSINPLSKDRLHLEIEAMRLAFADTNWFISDPQFNQIPLDELLSKSYAHERRKLIDPTRATLDQKRGSPISSSDTVYLSVVDCKGNACSLINSNYMGFGTGIVPAGRGFSLQNRGAGFSLDPVHPNALAPGKRPYHTIIPSLITDEKSGNLFACFGVMGGFMQPQGHLQVAIALIDDRVDPQIALNQPRFCIQDGPSGGNVALEEGIDVQTMAELASMGHTIIPVSGYNRSLFGRGQIIIRDQDTGALWGGSDPRADGCALPSL